MRIELELMTLDEHGPSGSAPALGQREPLPFDGVLQRTDMRETAAHTPERRRAPRIAVVASLLLLVTGCGTTEKDSASNPQSSAAPHVVEAHYFIGYGDAGVDDPKAGKVDVLTDGVRYRVLVVSNGPQNGDFRELVVFDGHHLFVDANDSAPRYVLYEAPQEHPDAVMFGSGFIFLPKMAPWNKMCGHDPPVPTSTGTILGRNAQSYRCPGDAKFPSFGSTRTPDCSSSSVPRRLRTSR